MNIFNNDAYQLSMLYAHWKSGRETRTATAEAFFRKMPSVGNKVIMAGAGFINEMLNSDSFRSGFSMEDMPYIQNHALGLSDAEFEPFQDYLLGRFPRELASLKISYARDGELLHPNFPVVQVEGPVGAQQMLETPLLSILNTTVRAATLARHLRELVGDRISLLDFSTRRQDADAAVRTAVGSVLGGFNATSNLEAGRLYHVPVRGTMAHAFVLSFGMEGELEAFKAFMTSFPQNHTLLVDTFDIRQGVANAMRASFDTGIALRAVRLDSGEWHTVIPMVREMLDIMGFKSTKIVVSGDYDTKLITKLKSMLLPSGISILYLVDGIGIGSYLAAPPFSMGFVYKLVEIEGKPVMKFSGEKTSFPGKKVWLKTQDVDGVRGNEVLPADALHEEDLEILLKTAGVENVLQEDEGPKPWTEGCIDASHRLTAARIAREESYWLTDAVDHVAQHLRSRT